MDKKNMMRNPHYPTTFTWLGLLLLLNACVSNEKIFQRAYDVSAQGDPCTAINILNEIRPKKRDDAQTLTQLLDAVRKLGRACVDKQMLLARQIGDNANTLHDYQRAYQLAQNAKDLSKIHEEQFADRLGARVWGLELWQQADEAYRLDMYETITEVLYKQALQEYEQGSLEAAYNHLAEVSKRQKDYKDSEEYMNRISVELAEKYYQAGKHALTVAREYQKAYDQFTLAQRWQPNYKDTDSLLVLSYDKVSDAIAEEARKAQALQQFRKAYQIYQDLARRDRALERYPQALPEAQVCLQAAQIRIFLDTDDRELNNYLYQDIRRNTQDEFLVITDKNTEADYYFLITLRPQNSRLNPVRHSLTAYLIRSYEMMQQVDSATVTKVRYFYAEEPVSYTRVNLEKRVDCQASYTIRGSGRHFPNTPPPSLSASAIDQVEYYELSGNYAPGDLLTRQIKRNPESNPRNKPQESKTWLDKFHTRRDLKSNDQLYQEAKVKIYDDVAAAIRKDLKIMLSKIE